VHARSGVLIQAFEMVTVTLYLRRFPACQPKHSRRVETITARGPEHTHSGGARDLGGRLGGKAAMYEVSCCGCSLKIFSKSGGERAAAAPEGSTPNSKEFLNTPFCRGVSPGDEAHNVHVSKQEWTRLNRCVCQYDLQVCLLYCTTFLNAHRWKMCARAGVSRN